MEHQHTPSVIEPDRPFRIHPAVWLIAASLIAALVAIFVFKVAIGTVITYSFLGLMLIGHLFMHGSHGGQGAHKQQRATPADADTPSSEKLSESKDEHTGQSGGCH